MLLFFVSSEKMGYLHHFKFTSWFCNSYMYITQSRFWPRENIENAFSWTFNLTALKLVVLQVQNIKLNQTDSKQGASGDTKAKTGVKTDTAKEPQEGTGTYSPTHVGGLRLHSSHKKLLQNELLNIEQGARGLVF